MKDQFLIIRMSKADKDKIRLEAENKRLTISSYARMQLINKTK